MYVCMGWGRGVKDLCTLFQSEVIDSDDILWKNGFHKLLKKHTLREGRASEETYLVYSCTNENR